MPNFMSQLSEPDSMTSFDKSNIVENNLECLFSMEKYSIVLCKNILYHFFPFNLTRIDLSLQNSE